MGFIESFGFYYVVPKMFVFGFAKIVACQRQPQSIIRWNRSEVCKLHIENILGILSVVCLLDSVILSEN